MQLFKLNESIKNELINSFLHAIYTVVQENIVSYFEQTKF